MYKQKSENGDKISVFLKQIMKKFSLFVYKHLHSWYTLIATITWG